MINKYNNKRETIIYNEILLNLIYNNLSLKIIII